MIRIGVDAGGTFTDFVVLDEDGELRAFKLRSNPAAPDRVILQGIALALQEASAGGNTVASIVHGSTVATNALLERKGARTALVTTKGFEDLLEIGRQNRAVLYNLTPEPTPLLIPRELCFGVDERAYFDGTIGAEPSAAELRRLVRKIVKSRAESVAICFLHAYRTAKNERAVARALKETGLYVCTSHDVSPEFREYERASTTAVNAYVGPMMESYLAKLTRGLPRRRFSLAIMQSSGGLLSAKDAGANAVRTVLSGPAGGVVGAAGMARRSGFRKALGFDMGGTSTDVGLIDGEPRQSTETYLEGMPIRVPMLDIHTVGAGGGSIARVDVGGLLHVGPESAGADPGPACYGTGTEPTVTDAHVVLGRIEALVGGGMQLDHARAKAAVGDLASKLGIDTIEAAAGILRVANANMERAIRVVSVERGYDPREFALVAFGGCGALHACEIATELGIGTVLVPENAGALSAVGMLMADAVRDYAAGVLGESLAQVERAFQRLEKQALRESPGAAIQRTADLRYRGQSYEVNVAWDGIEAAAKQFHHAHAALYGYAREDFPVEIVTIRVRARIAHPPLPKSHHQRSSRRRRTNPPATRRVWTAGRWRKIPILSRAEIASKPASGPALVADYGSTTLIPRGWRFHLDRASNLILTRGK